MASITFVTTCKGRLEHLRQSLPLMAGQPDAACVVVDYDCPDRCGEWVAASHPAVKVVRVENSPLFNPSHARNLGAAAADSPWIAFVDADILLAQQFTDTVLPTLAEKRYYRPDPLSADTWGTCIVSAPEFSAIAGYDDEMRPWGGEDDDLYWRLRTLLGCQPGSFDAALVQPLPHSDAARMRYSDATERWDSQRANSLYLHIKYDLMRLTGQRVLPRELRSRIYAEVRRTVLADARNKATATRIEISIPTTPEVPLWGWELKRTWIFELAKIPGMPASPLATA